MYAIVDIETTGGYAAANGITEISILVFDGNKVVEKFETLVNPGQPIPRYIQAMTGISDEMVSGAPSFSEIAESVYRVLQDKIFVAHNVNFDYSFIKAHFTEYGYEYNAKKLCTVRLSRKIFPGFISYSLGNLCRSLSIEIQNRHRAGGDAMATVEVFDRLLKNDTAGFIANSLKRTSKEQVLPPNVPKEDFDRLPQTPGVYYFHNQKGKVIYVGKARNIRSRVNSHFSNNSSGRQKQNFIINTYSISFESCATELMACIQESTEIRRLWPAFNYSQKRWEDVYGIFLFEDLNGYLRLGIEKNKKQLQALYTFHYLAEGHAILRRLIQEFDLCPRYCYMQTDHEACEGLVNGKCRGACEHKEDPDSYNARVQEAVASLNRVPSYAIVDKGMDEDQQSCILVLKGKLFGMGCFPKDLQLDPASLKDYVKPYRDNGVIRNLLNGYRERYPARVILIKE